MSNYVVGNQRQMNQLEKTIVDSARTQLIELRHALAESEGFEHGR